jgi:pimeloyl-ACP methyl ester carboxylesterase
MSELFVNDWGSGVPVVLVHGSLATGDEEWQAQKPLAELGFQLLAPDRRPYGRSPAAGGEDFLRDADDIVELMGDSAHIVGHSYGGLGAMFAAAQRPEATLSLTLLEPAAFGMSKLPPAARDLCARVREIWAQDLPDEPWLIRFLTAVGSDPDVLPPGFVTAALPLVPVVRQGRAPWTVDLPLSELAAAGFPKLVVSGAHNEGWDELCEVVATSIGARRAVAAGAGHEVQFAAPAVNDLMLALWRAVR